MKLDKSNRSYSLLRYFLVIITKDFEEIFISDAHKSYLRQVINIYFHPVEKDKKRKNVDLITSYISPNYIEINFQATPTLTLSEFIGSLKSTTSRKFFQKFPDLRVGKGLWSSDYFVVTREQFVQEHLSFYFALQKKKK